MIENKFKAWHKKEKKMYGGKEYVFLFLDGYWSCWSKITNDNGNFVRLKEIVCNFKTGELIRYIELRDKSGKEIYEVDIVRDDFTNVVGIIKWLNKKGMFRLCIDDSGYGFDLEIAPQHFEVIGNIYENPELLKELKK